MLQKLARARAHGFDDAITSDDFGIHWAKNELSVRRPFPLAVRADTHSLRFSLLVQRCMHEFGADDRDAMSTAGISERALAIGEVALLCEALTLAGRRGFEAGTARAQLGQPILTVEIARRN